MIESNTTYIIIGLASLAIYAFVIVPCLHKYLFPKLKKKESEKDEHEDFIQ